MPDLKVSPSKELPKSLTISFVVFKAGLAACLLLQAKSYRSPPRGIYRNDCASFFKVVAY